MNEKITKIIFITDFPFNKNSYDRIGVEYFHNHGLEVEIWDFTSCIHKNFIDQLIVGETVNFKDLRIFKEKSEIVKAISSLDKGCLIFCGEYSFRTFFIFRAISKHKINYFVLATDAFPSPYHIQNSFIGCIVQILKKGMALKFEEIIQHILNKILLKYYFIFGIAPASIILLGGEKSSENLSFPVNNTTTRLWANMVEYDSYLQLKTVLNDSCKITGVFLDQNYPFHSDFLYIGIENPRSPENYYPILCNFFKILEKNMNTEIVIAAHPKSDYDNLPDYFCGRTIIKGETACLVKESSFVIAHSSTSINFAVMFHKPIVFITTDEMQKQTSGKNIIGLYISSIALELGKIPINIDHVSGFDWDKEMKINEKAYLRYKNLYIKKSGTPEKPMWEIFCSYIQQNNIS